MLVTSSIISLNISIFSENQKDPEEEEEEEEASTDGKIKFRKPTKRPSTDLKVSTSKKSKTKAEKKEGKKRKGVKNTTLLSFDDEDWSKE